MNTLIVNHIIIDLVVHSGLVVTRHLVKWTGPEHVFDVRHCPIWCHHLQILDKPIPIKILIKTIGPFDDTITGAKQNHSISANLKTQRKLVGTEWLSRGPNEIRLTNQSENAHFIRNRMHDLFFYFWQRWKWYIHSALPASMLRQKSPSQQPFDLFSQQIIFRNKFP